MRIKKSKSKKQETGRENSRKMKIFTKEKNEQIANRLDWKHRTVRRKKEKRRKKKKRQGR